MDNIYWLSPMVRTPRQTGRASPCLRRECNKVRITLAGMVAPPLSCSEGTGSLSAKPPSESSAIIPAVMTFWRVPGQVEPAHHTRDKARFCVSEQ